MTLCFCAFFSIFAAYALTGALCQQRDLSWPCLFNLCPDKVTACSGDFGCPPPHCDPSRADDSVCEGAGCRGEPTSPTGGICGTFINFNRKKEGQNCVKHGECRVMFLCIGGQCRASKRIGAYTICSTVSRTLCPNGEECFTRGTNGEEGVCLRTTSDPDQFQQDAAAPFGAQRCDDAIPGRLGGPCKSSDLSCDVPFMCVDGCCSTTAHNKNRKGQRLPPQPNDANCRDALDSGETDADKSKCVDKKKLCRQRLYRKLMREQCPKTCGYCEGQRTSEDEEAKGEEEKRFEGDGTMPVNPSSGCSDRTVPGRASDCPLLRYLCDDDTYREVMRRQCPKTCGFCTDR
ncbi:hypothetical protein niasHT_001572 [Heterodera trifolii]|uniref:ShKT domain-containing protein n=1 Tax=Heterodera trifolii TaxID=157864 RepID=A0ABD2MDE3_9BILA